MARPREAKFKLGRRATELHNDVPVSAKRLLEILTQLEHYWQLRDAERLRVMEQRERVMQDREKQDMETRERLAEYENAWGLARKIVPGDGALLLRLQKLFPPKKAPAKRKRRRHHG